MESEAVISTRSIPGPQGDVDAIEYAPSPSCSVSARLFVVLMPGTSIRSGPGTDKRHKMSFSAEVPGIYAALGRALAARGVPSLQLCWRRFPADGGTLGDAVHDCLAGARFMLSHYGARCSGVLVGYSFGGAATLAVLERLFHTPEAGQAPGAKRTWFAGCAAISGALKGRGDDMVSLFTAMKYLEESRAPMMLIHGTEDSNVMPSAPAKLYRQAPPRKILCMLHGADHSLHKPRWVDVVTRLCLTWVSCFAAGSQGSDRGRPSHLAQLAAAERICEDFGEDSDVRIAMNPQLPPGKHHEFLVPPASEPFAPVPRGASAPPSQAHGRRRSEVIEEEARVARETITQRLSKHAERQKKARARRHIELVGPLGGPLGDLLRERLARQRRLTKGIQLPPAPPLPGTPPLMATDGDVPPEGDAGLLAPPPPSLQRPGSGSSGVAQRYPAQLMPLVPRKEPAGGKTLPAARGGTGLPT